MTYNSIDNAKGFLKLSILVSGFIPLLILLYFIYLYYESRSWYLFWIVLLFLFSCVQYVVIIWGSPAGIDFSKPIIRDTIYLIFMLAVGFAALFAVIANGIRTDWDVDWRLGLIAFINIPGTLYSIYHRIGPIADILVPLPADEQETSQTRIAKANGRADVYLWITIINYILLVWFTVVYTKQPSI